VCVFLITKFVITEILKLSSVIFKTIMVPLHSGRFVVVYLYSSFSMEPQGFSIGGKFIPKIPFLAILRAVSPHF